jgi:hypothetical protein
LLWIIARFLVQAPLRPGFSFFQSPEVLSVQEQQCTAEDEMLLAVIATRRMNKYAKDMDFMRQTQYKTSEQGRLQVLQCGQMICARSQFERSTIVRDSKK